MSRFHCTSQNPNCRTYMYSYPETTYTKQYGNYVYL